MGTAPSVNNDSGGGTVVQGRLDGLYNRTGTRTTNNNSETYTTTNKRTPSQGAGLRRQLFNGDIDTKTYQRIASQQKKSVNEIDTYGQRIPRRISALSIPVII